MSEESLETLVKQNKGPSVPLLSSTSKRIYYIRHGEVIPPGGVHGVLYGSMDVSLSQLGELEAKVAAFYLKDIKLNKIASSPLKRAKFGATEILKNQKHLTSIDVYPGFSELDRGEWCGKTKVEIGLKNLERFDNCDESVTPTGGESYPSLKARVLKARDEFLNSIETGETAALVSHIQVTRCILSDALEIPTNKMTDLKIATASITCIDYCDETHQATVQFSSFKPNAGLAKANDGGNYV